MSLEPQTIGIEEARGSHLASWRNLADGASTPNPFFEEAFVGPGAANLDGEAPELLIATDGARWTGCVPVIRERGWRRTPIRCTASWMHPYCFAGTPLLRAGSESETLRCWIEGQPWTNFLGLDLTSGSGAFADVVEEFSGRFIVYEAADRAGARRTPDGFVPDLRPKRRRELERQRRRLEDKLETPLETVDCKAAPGAVEEFLTLEAAGWKGVEGTALASTPRDRGFFTEMCRGFGEGDRLSIFRLGAADRIVAMLCCIRGGDTLFEFKIAFDESLAEFSPGIQIERDVLRLVGEEMPDVATIDSCAIPTNTMANRFFPDRLPIRAIALPVAGFRGQLARFTVDKTAKVRNVARRHR